MAHFKDEYGILGLSVTPKLNQSSFDFFHFFYRLYHLNKSLLAKYFLNNRNSQDIEQKNKSLRLSLMFLEHSIEEST